MKPKKVKDIYESPLSDKHTERFWSYVNKTSSCWEWSRFCNKGYGAFNVKGVSVYVHKLSWCLRNGPVPDGLCVMHKCDNRKCVNPDHLMLGTTAENNLDKEAKGRGVNLKGSSHGMSKFTEDDILSIRANLKQGNSLSSLARQYKVSVPTISRIRDYETWKHVGG